MALYKFGKLALFDISNVTYISNIYSEFDDVLDEDRNKFDIVISGNFITIVDWFDEDESFELEHSKLYEKFLNP